MSYPQPQLADQIRAGTQQWRLITQVNGPGEIYELDAPCSSIALGPESDFGQVAVSYLDQGNQPTEVSTIRVTPQFSAPLSVTPNAGITYPLSPTRKGRVYAWALDNWNTGYLPSGFDVTKMQLFFVEPQLDLIGWQGAPPTVPTRRGDKSFYYQTHSATTVGAGNGGVWRVFPVFGRKYVYVDLFNNNAAIDLANYQVRGVCFSVTSNPNPLGAGPRDDSETQIVAPVAVAHGTANRKPIPASTNGMYDAIAVYFEFPNGGTITDVPLRVTVSDDPM